MLFVSTKFYEKLLHTFLHPYPDLEYLLMLWWKFHSLLSFLSKNYCIWYCTQSVLNISSISLYPASFWKVGFIYVRFSPNYSIFLIYNFLNLSCADLAIAPIIIPCLFRQFPIFSNKVNQSYKPIKTYLFYISFWKKGSKAPRHPFHHYVDCA